MDKKNFFDEFCLNHKAELRALERMVNKDKLRDKYGNVVFTPKDKVYHHRDDIKRLLPDRF